MPEKNKHLLLHTFQIEDGCFGSVLVDITVEHFLAQELQKSREEIQRVLETTTDLVFQYIHQDMMKQEKLKKKAQIDLLTRVLNAGAGRQNIQKLLESQGEKPKGYHAMFLMDIDDFKKINDTCGDLLGDQVLEIFGRILCRTFRKEDIIYHLGGDEFVAFVENMETPDPTIRSIMQRLNSHLGEMRKEYACFSSSTGEQYRSLCDEGNVQL